MTPVASAPLLRDVLSNKKPTVALRSSLVVILAWIASSDARFDAREKAFLRSVSKDLGSDTYVDTLIAIGTNQRPRDVAVAAGVLQRTLREEGPRLFIEMCLGIMLADGAIKFSEAYIIQLIVDLLGFSAADLDAIFTRLTGRRFPRLGDPSRREYWSRVEDRGHSRRRPRAQRDRAFDILGVAESATAEEIRAAYRRLARVHHPDRFHSLGPEATQTAHKTFLRIRWAYEQLGGS